MHTHDNSIIEDTSNLESNLGQMGHADSSRQSIKEEREERNNDQAGFQVMLQLWEEQPSNSPIMAAFLIWP